MDRIAVPQSASRATVFQCGLAAHGVVEAALPELRALRDEPGVPPGPPVPPRFLRHADEQAVVGLAAVLRAVGDPALREQRYAEWGVLAAPQFPGRLAGAGALSKFVRDGAATVSPHVIPQYSLHSVAGTISVALGLHGPNFGIGGGREALSEGLTAALTFFDPETTPGLWLVLTGWDPEPIPDGAGSSQSNSVCRGVALALVAVEGASRVLRLTVEPKPQAAPAANVPTLAGLISRLAQPARDSCDPIWSCPLPWGGQVELLPSMLVQRKAA